MTTDQAATEPIEELDAFNAWWKFFWEFWGDAILSGDLSEYEVAASAWVAAQDYYEAGK